MDASPLASAVVGARLLQYSTAHLKKTPSEHNNITAPQFWQRHHELNSLVDQTLLKLPDNLRVDQTTDPLAIWANMSLHLLTINLCQAAALVAKQEGNLIGADSLTARARRAAFDMVGVARANVSMSVRRWYSHTPFGLYTAFTVFVCDVELGHNVSRASENICFLLEFTRMFRTHWRSAQMIISQMATIVESLQAKGFELNVKVDPEDTVQLGAHFRSEDDIEGLGPLFAKKTLLNNSMHRKDSVQSANSSLYAV